MSAEQEINDALDAIEAEAEEVVEEVEVVEETDEVVEEVEETKPPGYLTYDEWIAKGKDPADYKGENAYKAEYERIKEIRELKDTMNQVVSGVETWQQQQSEIMAQQIEQAKREAAAKLAQAKEDDDIEGALAAQEELTSLDKQATRPVKLNPAITEFAQKNPIVDPKSAQYDAEFHQDMIMIHNGKLDQLLGGDRTRAGELTQAQIERVQKLAFNQAKELHADKFVSPRNKRTAPAKPSKRATQTPVDPKVKLSQVPGNSKNPRDASPAADIYEIIKARDPKAAETFAKNLTGE